jgi:hypothetical protein
VKREELDGQGMWHVWGAGEVCAGVLVGKPDGKRPLEDLLIDGRVIL